MGGCLSAADLGYCVSVRELCEFAAKAGDLDLRFTPAPSAQEGIELHQLVARRRQAEHGDDFRAEMRLSGCYAGLTIQGRADGWLPALAQLEEVKSFRGRLDKMPINHRALHWAQLKLYGWLLSAQEGLTDLRLALIYVDAADNSEHPLVEYWSAVDLASFGQQLCDRFAAWAQQETAHRLVRQARLETLVFPFPDFHAGQRQFAENIFKAIKTQRCLLAEAPTGIGKTLASLFPALKAANAIDKLFFLCAKTPGRALALAGLQQLGVTELRVVELISREKACEHPDLACHGDSCPLARGFYDRLAAARTDAVAHGWMDAGAIKAVARAHQICPYYLSQELCRWADVVVGDYNYYFDSSALLYSMATRNQWRVAVLVDEAHNLIERARAMYSAGLSRAHAKLALKTAPKVLHASLKAVDKRWQSLLKGHALGARFTLTALPENFLLALQAWLYECSRWQAEKGEPLTGCVQEFFFAAGQLLRVAECADETYIIDVEKTGRGEAQLQIRNVVPAPWLRPRFEASVATVLFSATLQPLSFQRSLLGLPDDAVELSVPSPFSGDQLQVRIARHISTRYSHRQQSLPDIVTLVLDQYQRQPGNYLLFFSSFAYLEQAAQALQQANPQMPMWCQSRGMNEARRQDFVDRFCPGGRGVGLAVLGGAFGEGIDLTGDRLVGAFIATLGMPQFNPVNEDFRARLDRLFGNGYDAVYVYPGLQKVVQAAGRIIRSQSDRGVLYLLDDRFSQEKIRALLPAWWLVEET